MRRIEVTRGDYEITGAEVAATAWLTGNADEFTAPRLDVLSAIGCRLASARVPMADS